MKNVNNVFFHAMANLEKQEVSCVKIIQISNTAFICFHRLILDMHLSM